MPRLPHPLWLCWLGPLALLAQDGIPAPPPPAGGAVPSPPPAATLGSAAANPASGEVQRCEDRIASAQRDVLDRYDAALQELQTALQKAADLEGAVAVRTERQRAAASGTLAEANFVDEPKALRSLQVQMATRAQDLISAQVQETVPRLVELKKQLTVAGKLDEALAVRSSIERLQNNYLTVIRPEPNSAVSLETLLRSYASDRPRADATYKGVRLTVQGTVAGFRADPADQKNYQLYLTTGNGAAGYLQCSFSMEKFRFREERQFNVQSVSVTSSSGDTATRLQRGSVIAVAGVCAGRDENVRLQRCEFAKQ